MEGPGSIREKFYSVVLSDCKEDRDPQSRTVSDTFVGHKEQWIVWEKVVVSTIVSVTFVISMRKRYKRHEFQTRIGKGDLTFILLPVPDRSNFTPSASSRVLLCRVLYFRYRDIGSLTLFTSSDSNIVGVYSTFFTQGSLQTVKVTMRNIYRSFKTPHPPTK